MPTILGRDYEDSAAGAVKFQFDLMNPLDTDFQMFMLRLGYGTAISTGGFAVASLITGTSMPSMFVQSITRAYGTADRVRNASAFVVRFAPQMALVGSAVAPAIVTGKQLQCLYLKHIVKWR